MASNVAVRITADTADLQAKLAVASASSRAFSTELNNLAKQAVAAGGATPELNAQLQKVASQSLAAKSQVAGLRAELGTARTGMQEFGGAASLVSQSLGALGIVASIGSVIEFGKSVFDAAEHVQHESEVLQLSTTAYQDYTKAGMLAGVATDTIDTSLRRFNAAQGLAQTGIGQQAKAFNDLGVSAKLPAEDALPALARALISLEDPARRARDIQILFGRSGAEMIPLLEQWAQGTGALTEKLTALGLIMDPKVVAAAKATKVEMDTTWSQVAVAWAPAVNFFSSAIAGLLTNLTKLPAYLSQDFGIGESEIEQLTASAQKAQGAIEGAYSGSGTTHRTPPPTKQPTPNFTDDADAKKAAAQARRIADEIATAYQQGNLRHISSEQSTNSALLEMGQKTIAQWLAQETSLEDHRYEIALKGAADRIKADAGDGAKLAKDWAEEAQLFQEHKDKLTATGFQYQAKQKQQDAAAVQNFVKIQQDRLEVLTNALDKEYNAGQISGEDRFNQEYKLTAVIERNILQRKDAEIAALTAGTAAYENAMRERETLEQQFTKTIQNQETQLAASYAKTWAPVTSGFNTMVHGLLSGNETLVQVLVQGADTMLQAWIDSQLKQLEESIFTDEAKATVAATSRATQGALNVGEVTGQAAVAAAAAFADFASLGPVGLAAAPGAAAAAEAAVLAFAPQAAFDVGTNFVPRTMIAQVHQGERIIPAADNSALMNALNGGGGGDSHFAITVNVPGGNGQQVVQAIKTAIRTGYLNRGTLAPA